MLLVSFLFLGILAPFDSHSAFAVGFVIFNFFLFCNIFRIARSFELIWSAIFLSLMMGSTIFGWPNFIAAVAASLTTTVIVIAIEMRKPSYHGVFWQRINPELLQWYQRHRS